MSNIYIDCFKIMQKNCLCHITDQSAPVEFIHIQKAGLIKLNDDLICIHFEIMYVNKNGLLHIHHYGLSIAKHPQVPSRNIIYIYIFSDTLCSSLN